jgi:hypothetical protein
MSGSVRGGRLQAVVGLAGDSDAIRSQYLAYRELKALREAIPVREPRSRACRTFMGVLIADHRAGPRAGADHQLLRPTVSFTSGCSGPDRVRGCRSAVLRRRRAAADPPVPPQDLLQSLSEAAATAPAWSEREPCFYPEKVEAEPA